MIPEPERDDRPPAGPVRPEPSVPARPGPGPGRPDRDRGRGGPEERVRLLYRRVYQREPTPRQLEAALALVEAAAEEPVAEPPPTAADWQIRLRPPSIRDSGRRRRLPAAAPLHRRGLAGRARPGPTRRSAGSGSPPRAGIPATTWPMPPSAAGSPRATPPSRSARPLVHEVDAGRRHPRVPLGSRHGMIRVGRGPQRRTPGSTSMPLEVERGRHDRLRRRHPRGPEQRPVPLGARHRRGRPPDGPTTWDAAADFAAAADPAARPLGAARPGPAHGERIRLHRMTTGDREGTMDGPHANRSPLDAPAVPQPIGPRPRGARGPGRCWPSRAPRRGRRPTPGRRSRRTSPAGRSGSSTSS